MNIQRESKTVVVVSFGEIIQALKLLNPRSAEIAAMPDNGTNLLVNVTAGGRNLVLTYLGEVPPAPIRCLTAI